MAFQESEVFSVFTDIEKILKLINSYGLSLLITAIVILFLVRYVHEKLFPKPTKHQDSPENYNIQSHSVFSTLDYIVKIGVPRLFFQNRFKQVLFKDFLGIIFTTTQQTLRDMLNQDLLTDPPFLLEQKITKIFTQMLLDIEHNVGKDLTLNFSDIPEGEEPERILLSKYNQIFENHHRLIFQAIRENCQTDIFFNNGQRISAILYAMKLLMLLLMLDAERVFAEMDGQFAGWTYKGITNHSQRIEGR